MKALALLSASVAAMLLPAVTFAQTTVSGCVLDAGTEAPLPGVTVLAEGTTLATSTGAEGCFSLVLAPSIERLVFTYVGYQPQTVDLSEHASPLRVSLVPRLMDLQPIVVSASRHEEKRTDAPIAVAAISAAQLQATKPNMLYEALNTVPGVHMTNLGNEQHNMSIRQPLSYGALYTYLEDGIPIRPTGIFNHNALTEINMAGIERIEVVRGPSSSLYGADAIGGAINFITPSPAQSPTGYLSIRADDYGYRRGDFSASTTLGHLGVYGGGYLARQRHGWADHSDFDKRSLTLRADYAFTPLTKLVTTFTTNHLDTDTNGNLDSLNFYRRGYTSLQTFTYRKVDATRLTSRLSHVWNQRSSTDLAVFWRDNAVGQLPHYRIKNILGDPGHAAGEVNDDRFWSLGLDARHRQYFRWLGARLITGVTLDRSPNTYIAHFIDIDRDPATGRYLRYHRQDSLLTDYRVDLLNAAGYAQLEVSPLAHLKLVGSLRFDHIAYGFDNHLPPSAFSGSPDGRNTYDRLSPRAGLTYDFGGGRGVYANYSRGFLPPEVSELYRGVKIPLLEPATFDSYEAGGWVAFLHGHLNAEASLYRMEGTNEIISVRLEDGSTEKRNAGRTRHTGVEYALTLLPTSEISIRLSGTNARHSFIRYELDGQNMDGNVMDAAPDWMANAALFYRPHWLPGSRAGLEWEHVGPYYMDPQNTLRYSGYDLLNLRMGYLFHGVEVWANVLNLTDVFYANIAAKSRFGQQYTPGAPRSISIGLAYHFGR